MPAALKSINGVEIFAAGTWNGDTYTEKDLDEMVRAFHSTRKGWPPYIKLGHDDKQKIIQNDGLPAAGWIGNLYRSGKKLMADFIDIPEKIYQLIENRAYRKVSSEIYWNVEVNGERYPFLLGAVALLGSDLPGVHNLTDILGMYGIKLDGKIKIYNEEDKDAKVKTYSFEDLSVMEDEMPKTEAELKLELELQQAKEAAEKQAAELKKFTDEQAALKAQLDAANKEKADAQALVQKAEQEKVQAQREAFATELESKKIATPAMRPFILALLGDEKKEYSVQVNKEEKKFSKQDLLKECLKLHTATEVNQEEGSEEGQEQGGDADAKIAEEIQKYMKDNKCNYSTAYKAVTKTHRPAKSSTINKMVDADAE